MWTLALGGIFLAAVEACVFCRFPDRELSGRLARLCSQMEVQWKDCEVSWTFSAFALGKIRHPGMGLTTISPVPQGACKWPHSSASQPSPQSTALSGHTFCSLWESFFGPWERAQNLLPEIKGSLYSLPSYWQWLRKTKLREYNREALCPPSCRGSTILYNCSTCQGFEVYCWPRKRCFPGSHDLWEARILLLFVCGTALLLGVPSLAVEYNYFQAKS
ncbi:sperm-egg fusion protein TMEM95 isoform X4 [Bos javanicus]|uniref:sperm-egg fusion protein TMEM95 isoform X4 n=1 Tax=Bos javanicus TaxID=9906 RepID=UPI002AA60070|nr:sperm-egg fusion protein TMEM95 isoform X4 [Bos javanicus]